MLSGGGGISILGRSSRSSRTWVFMLLGFATVLRTSSIYAGFSLVQNSFSILFLTWSLLAGSALCYAVIYRPFQSLTRDQMLQIGFHSVVLVLSTLFWGFSLYYYG